MLLLVGKSGASGEKTGGQPRQPQKQHALKMIKRRIKLWYEILRWIFPPHPCARILHERKGRVSPYHPDLGLFTVLFRRV